MQITFRTVVVGERFELNGNNYIKRSTRTAQITGGVGGGRTFYIPQLAPCIVAG